MPYSFQTVPSGMSAPLVLHEAQALSGIPKPETNGNPQVGRSLPQPVRSLSPQVWSRVTLRHSGVPLVVPSPTSSPQWSTYRQTWGPNSHYEQFSPSSRAVRGCFTFPTPVPTATPAESSTAAVQAAPILGPEKEKELAPSIEVPCAVAPLSASACQHGSVAHTGSARRLVLPSGASGYAARRMQGVNSAQPNATGQPVSLKSQPESERETE